MIKVYISPSVQEKNIGYGNYKSEEYRANIIASETEKELKRHGIITKRNNPEMTLKQIVKDSNDFNPDVHKALHTNAYNKKSRGCEVFCNKFGGEGHRLAKSVYNRISAITPTADRGVKEGYNFYGKGKHMYELYYTKAPAALSEVAFHDNPEDSKWIINNSELIGREIAIGILNYFKINYIPEVSKEIYYRVISGSFKDKENAENHCKHLIQHGFDSFIMEYKK